MAIEEERRKIVGDFDLGLQVNLMGEAKKTTAERHRGKGSQSEGSKREEAEEVILWVN